MKRIFLLCIAIMLIFVSCTPSENVPEKVEGNDAIENRNEVEVGNVGNQDVTDDESDENGENTIDVTVGQDEKDDGDNKTGDKTEEAVPEPKPEMRICPEFSDDRWIIKPAYGFDTLETFGMTGYSIYTKDGKYGIVDMSANGIGTGDYSRLFYCPTHGLSCPDIRDASIEMREDLYLAPDCGYEYDPETRVVYVFDPTRDRVYMTGYSDGFFRIVDITETEYFSTNERYTVVLYDCDADLLMYEGIGMPDIETVFAMENKEMHYGVIDSDMDYVIACIYDEVLDGNDCYIVKQNGRYGYRAVTGREYYPCVFESAQTAYKGAAWVKYGGLWGTVRF